MPILSRRSGRDERAALYPPELLAHFDDAFIASFDLFEEYIARQALAVFRSTGLEAACRSDDESRERLLRILRSAGVAPAREAHGVFVEASQPGRFVHTVAVAS